MRQLVRTLIIAPAFLVAAGCSKDKPAADSTLNSDLGLAAQANGARLDSITAAERLNSNTAVAPVGAAPALTTPAPVHRSTASTSTHRSTTTHRSSGTRSSGTSSGSSSGTSSGTVASEPRTEIHKNTKRDAAIGAAAGAVLGGVVGKGGVKGAVIGGVAGGILGGVIGNNVDVQKKKVP